RVPGARDGRRAPAVARALREAALAEPGVLRVEPQQPRAVQDDPRVLPVGVERLPVRHERVGARAGRHDEQEQEDEQRQAATHRPAAGYDSGWTRAGQPADGQDDWWP